MLTNWRLHSEYRTSFTQLMMMKADMFQLRSTVQINSKISMHGRTAPFLCVGKAVLVCLTFSLLPNNGLVEGNKFFISPDSSECVIHVPTSMLQYNTRFKVFFLNSFWCFFYVLYHSNDRNKNLKKKFYFFYIMYVLKPRKYGQIPYSINRFRKKDKNCSVGINLMNCK